MTGDQLDPAGSQDHRACISSNAVPVLDHLSDFCTPSFGPPAVTGAQFDPSGGQEVRARIAASSSSRSTIGQQVQAASFRRADADSVIATRQFLVYFQARYALGKSQGYLESSVRPEYLVWFVVFTAGLGVIFTAGLGVTFTAGLGVIFTAGLGVIFTAGLGVIVTAGLGVIFTAGLGVIFTAGLGVIFTAGLGVIFTACLAC